MERACAAAVLLEASLSGRERKGRLYGMRAIGNHSPRKRVESGGMLRTPGDRGFMTPRAEDPHGKRHRRDQKPSRAAEPHERNARTERPALRKDGTYGP